MNRRDFCLAAAASFGLSSLDPRCGLARGAGRSAEPISAVVFDERFADARIFAEALVGSGAAAFPFRGDSGALWYGALRAQLRLRPGRVAGLTTYADLLIARACGRELALRPLFEGVEDARGGAGVRRLYRTATADADMLDGALSPENLALAFTRMAGAASKDWRAVEAFAPRRSGNPAYMTSWLLAPS